jgi:DNA-binding transcriptional LysR family regulator
MDKFDTDQLDVKTMRLAVGIWKTKSVSAAAINEDLSQSTASYRLDRLRAALDDAIFIRGASGMEPTVFGRHAMAAFDDILTRLDLLTEKMEFDPAKATRDFVIAATAFEIETVLTALHRHFLRVAPGCRLIVRPMETRNLAPALHDTLDLALLSVPPKSSVLKQVLILEDELVTYFDSKVRKSPKTLEAFCAADHAVASLGGSARSGVDVELRKLNRKRRIKLETSNLESLPPLMRGTPLITTIPAKLGKGLMRDFASVRCPLTFPVISFHAVWHQARDDEPGHQWLRKTLTNVAKLI